jgi:DNA-directed RNA polymerase beta subunit
LVDNSLIYTKSETFIADKIIYKDDVDPPFVLIRIKSFRPVEEGDKFSSRAGCKGTVGEVKNPWDMPYTKAGLIPDIIMNPLSVPTRMIVGQLMEMLIARKLVYDGGFFDGSPFQKVDIPKMIEELEKVGINASREIMYNAKTGERMNALVYTSPCYM